jgi:erythromycin esterase
MDVGSVRRPTVPARTLVSVVSMQDTPPTSGATGDGMPVTSHPDQAGQVVRWIERHARPLTDLGAQRALVGEATVVALGLPTHGARELTTIAQELLELMVDHMGFRALAMEENQTASSRIDDHLLTGSGDLQSLVGDLHAHHRTQEVLDILGWMRARNQAQPSDPVHFVGLDPGLEDLPAGADRIAYVEPRLADNAVRWHERTGDKIVYVGGFTHTAVDAARTVSIAGRTATHRNAGSHLRNHFGQGYRSIGLTFHRGSVDPGSGPLEVPASAEGFTEALLHQAGSGPYLLDLGIDRPDPVQSWLDGPAKLRLVGPWYDPTDDTSFHMTGRSLTHWFDALVHIDTVTATRALPPVAAAARDPRATH